jgi:hypothetical protein
MTDFDLKPGFELELGGLLLELIGNSSFSFLSDDLISVMDAE